METAIEFTSVVDSLLEDFARERVPAVPSVIAEVLCQVFYRCEPEADRTQYRRDLEGFVRARLEIFLLRESGEARYLA